MCALRCNGVLVMTLLVALCANNPNVLRMLLLVMCERCECVSRDIAGDDGVQLMKTPALIISADFNDHFMGEFV